MSDVPEDQIESWLKKLERESWQLELLVSAFTIFLLLGANSSFENFLLDLSYEYNTSGLGFVLIYMFLVLIKYSIKALTVSLIVHLMLRGFWIGTIGLRSVQSEIEFDKLNFNEFFTKKLRKNVISLDQLVVRLDELCSVIFAFSFLVISILIAIGMYILFVGILGFVLSLIVSSFSGLMSTILIIASVLIILLVLLTGIIYMIDFFTIGFFKKIKWFSKAYYPFYSFYNAITLSKLSRSIYYYLISKFSKRRIRLVYGFIGFFICFFLLVSFDQYQYHTEETNKFQMMSNRYDNLRPSDQYITDVSISSNVINDSFLSVFLRYNPSDNPLIRNNCPDYEPLKDDGFNWNFVIKAHSGGFNITGKDYSAEDFETLLECQSSIYQVVINDSTFNDLSFRFYIHPSKGQKGLVTMIPTESFRQGENVLEVKKVRMDSAKAPIISDFASVPFWFNR